MTHFAKIVEESPRQTPWQDHGRPYDDAFTRNLY